MDYRQLRSFVVLADVLHFGKAALQMNIAQPALSQHIKALETSLGITLFTRDKRHVELTFEGQQLVDVARTTLMSYDKVIDDARSLRLGYKGKIKLGYVGSSILDPALAMLIKGYRQHHPDIDIVIEEHNVSEQLTLLQNYQLDIALLRSPVPHFPELKYHNIVTRRLDVVLPAQHPLASEHALSLSSLSDETFLVQKDPPGIGLGWSTLYACQQAGFVPQNIQFTRDVSVAIGLVSMGAGITLVPETQRSLMIQDVSYARLTDPAATTTLTFSWQSRVKNNALAGFVQYVTQFGTQRAGCA